MKKAVVVFSGGQDSTTCLVQAQARYDEVHAITFDYGQRHRAEIDTARHLATALGIAAHNRRVQAATPRVLAGAGPP